ncbi:tetratricopeptide repeat protein [Duganella vulcania]|uniref:tetratricopeptide repeat protein n=1 Tax=Duganella vulcania TaxID=2692166 RepID=UPI001581E7EB|nr:tetratricopeptide repeat protein [Duganella vulcania]
MPVRILFTLILSFTAGLSQAASNFSFDVTPGPHSVGLRVVEQYDYARGYLGKYDVVTGKPVSGETARPMQTVIWYPAQKSGKAVAYGDYFRLGATEERFDNTEAAIAANVDSRLKGAPIGAVRAREEMTRRMWALRDARSAAGKFPVVIYAPSFGASTYENADLCEYLASHGYIVITSPSMGAHARGMSDDQEGIEAQAGDIAFLIGYAHTLPQADTGHIAVAGYSWGGISNVFVAARDSRVKALVNLDGSVRYWPERVQEAKYVQPARVAVPMLFLAARPRSLEDLAKRNKPNASFLNELKYSDVYTVTLPAMEHFAFASEALRFVGDDAYNEYTPAEVSQSHGWMARYTLQFLDAYLKGQASAKAFLSKPPKQNGVPDHLLTVSARMSEGAPPTLEMLAYEAAKSGFADIQQVYEKMRKREPKFEVSEDNFNSWGYQLLRAGDKQGAIAVFKLAAVLHPDSGNAHDSLAEAYEAAQDKPLAIQHYQRALELNPKNGNAVQHLKSLGAPL